MKLSDMFLILSLITVGTGVVLGLYNGMRFYVEGRKIPWWVGPGQHIEYMTGGYPLTITMFGLFGVIIYFTWAWYEVQIRRVGTKIKNRLIKFLHVT